MPGKNILHTVEILSAVVPYMDPRSKTTMDLLIKFYEFFNCYQIFKTSRLTACNYEKQDFDMEAVLNKIRPTCDEKEQANIDKILNIYKAKKMMEMYNTYMSVMNTMQDAEGSQGNSSDKSGFADNILKNFSGFDFSSIFNGSAPDVKPETDTSDVKAAENNSGQFNFETEEKTSDHYNSSGYDSIFGHSSESKADNSSSTVNDTVAGDSTNSAKSDSGSNNKSQEDMYNSLKGMLSPEQISTFENLRMLFNAMSYDNNRTQP